jgi:hypothetical protein
MTRTEPESAKRNRRTPLAERPPISAPRATGPHVQRSQPALGLLGLLFVVPIAAALAIGAGGDGSTVVIGPVVTYSLPLVAMVAFWWEDWPGTRVRSGLSGWADTVLIAVGAVVLTGVGQAVAGRADPAAIFDPAPGPGHVPTFPATLPLAGAAFVAMLELTLVGEGWPLRRLPRIPAGLLAVVISWAVALVLYFGLAGVDAPPGSDVAARHGPVPGAVLGAVLVDIGAWQVLFSVVWRGWPFSEITNRAPRLTCAHIVVIGGGVLTYLVVHVLGQVSAARTAAVVGCFVASGLLFGMLFEDLLHGRLNGAAAERAVLLALTVAFTAVLAFALFAAADAVDLTRADTDEWVEHAALNALALSIILHVGVGRRWPFAPPATAQGQRRNSPH